MHVDFTALKERIERNLLAYVAARSDSNSPLEHNIDAFFENWAGQVPYFQQHPKHWGLFPIPNDHLDRNVAWCLLKGEGSDALVFIHHHDCVETPDYGALEPLCLDPAALEDAFRAGRMKIPQDAQDDLASGAWMFGRGVCDMKGGASVQLSLLEQYSQDAGFHGNIVLISVPDEENLSAGMRGACYLLKELKDTYGLTYKMMLNCEPHEREEDSKVGSLYDGSIGKIMPIVYVRGKLAHAGQVFGGLNPINLLAEIVRRTELNPFFIERVGNTVCPPCTWLYGKDQKLVYDVSLPLAAVGCLSVLPLQMSPMEIMNKLHSLCEEAFEDVIKDMNASYTVFLDKWGLPQERLPWQPKVRYFSEVYAEAERDGGAAFLEDYKAAYEKAKQGFRSKTLSTVQAANLLIETTLKHVKDLSPTVVLAIAPPYYPSVNNHMLDAENAAFSDQALTDLVAFGRSLGETYQVLNYFVGISDLSYAMFKAEPENISYIENNMLLWGDIYRIPLDIIRELSMPVCNVGPWGKDLHRYTERVNKHDLFEITPRMVDFMVRRVLGD